MSRRPRQKKPMSRRTRAAWLAVATAAGGLATLPGAVMALFSPLVFDYPGNLANPLAWIGFVMLMGFWIVCLAAPLAAWFYWRSGDESRAWLGAAAPLGWFLVMALVLQFVPS